MKTVLNSTLTSLALLACSFSAQAYQLGGSVRGDVGMLGNQVPYLMVQTGTAPTTPVEMVTDLSRRKQGQWDFTGRLFIYTTCTPCPSYIAASWQGSKHTVHSCSDLVESSELAATIPFHFFHVNGGTNSLETDSVITNISNGMPILAKAEVKNTFSKAKLGVGIDLIKTCCFIFTMEAGGNYLNAQLKTNQNYVLTQTVAEGPGFIVVPPGVQFFSSDAGGLPFDYVINNDISQKTEGVGLYTSLKAEYKFPAKCLNNSLGIYGKAEVAGIISRQKYDSDLCYITEFAPNHTPLFFVTLYEFNNCSHRYNNVIEVDLEAALVYTPCFKCWDNLNLNFALGLRTDSFVNLFSKPLEAANVSYLSLTRPTIFLEVGIKV